MLNFISIARMHHIRSRSKFRRLQQCAESAPVSGLAKSGRPGVLVFQGTQDAISNFLQGARSLRYLDFHHVSTRPCEPGPLTSKPGLREVYEMRDLVQTLEEMGLKHWFLAELRMGGRTPGL
ncbi:hypothetical protein C8F01DRAFT_992749 [Mycena amicta]|nr:hypothetical protein C8F01DRAFT_992749 [Mycena amicta]